MAGGRPELVSTIRIIARNLAARSKAASAAMPDEVDGIAWGCERMGPLQNMIGGTWSH